MHQLVVRGGTVMDGLGGRPFVADVAIDDGVIAAVGVVENHGETEIEAAGNIVAPGFVDIHTHYDGQVSWDPLLTPSSYHGVTTVVMGNCGVGFAPVVAGQRDWLINLMEGVEDIPGTVLAEGIRWDWETFPEYLNAIDEPHAINFAAQLPHGALRTYVMGARGSDHVARATETELARMASLAAEAIRAGALGWSTSRTLAHKSKDGRPTPSLTAPPEELISLARGLAEADAGVVDLISDFIDEPGEMELIREIARAGGRPVSVTVMQAMGAPHIWRRWMSELGDISRETGVPITGQVAPRAVGMVFGWDLTLHPFRAFPTYRRIEHLPAAEKIAALLTPEVRAALLAEQPEQDDEFLARIGSAFEFMYPLGDPPDYEPGPETSVAAIAARTGRTPVEVAYDLLSADGGTGMIYYPRFNYDEGNLDVVAEMLAREDTVPALGDAGAHVGVVCDASFPTTLITHWGRDRRRGVKFAPEWLVKRQTSDTARMVGLLDRGIIAPGYRGDLNVIDFDELELFRPEVVHDLPTGGRRLLQRAKGYKHTVVSGVEVLRDGVHTGALPGRLVRGAQLAPDLTGPA